MSGKPYRSGSAPVAKRQVYEVVEIRRAIHACPPTPSGQRDRLAIMILWCAGLKPSELLALRPDDYTDNMITAGDREVVLPGGQRRRLRQLHDRWIRHRSAVANPESPLLCNLRGGPLDGSYLRHMLSQLSEEAELGKRLHAQGFRNTFAAAMHYGGVPMEIIRRQLGLSDLEYTAGYVGLVAPVGQHKAMGSFRLE